MEKPVFTEEGARPPAASVDESAITVPAPHGLECDVRRRLLADPRLKFSSLVVRRLANGICLEGVLETVENCPDICRLVRDLCGSQKVVNRLVVHSRQRPPAKV